MGLFGKLKEILFDEETVEIPVITKEPKEEKSTKTKVKEEPVEQKRSTKKDDEVIIKKIETPKRVESDEDLFDMPKLKEEAQEELKSNTFTFPVFDDEEKEIVTEKRKPQKEPKKEEPKRSTPERRASGYTNAYDYSYGKYKGDYKTSRDAHQEVLSKSLEIKEEKKAFTPSPIISPVYGVLNENYKKEDIVTKSEHASTTTYTSQALDLDSVRRKAYGTLEDEIEISLGRKEEAHQTEKLDILEDDGISIDDLLVDKDENANEVEVVEMDTHELFEQEDMEVPEEIELDEDTENVDSAESEDDKIEETYSVEEPLKVEKTDNKKEAIGEEDLFDLIDSLYEGKGEE